MTAMRNFLHMNPDAHAGTQLTRGSLRRRLAALAAVLAAALVTVLAVSRMDFAMSRDADSARADLRGATPPPAVAGAAADVRYLLDDALREDAGQPVASQNVASMARDSARRHRFSY